MGNLPFPVAHKGWKVFLLFIQRYMQQGIMFASVVDKPYMPGEIKDRGPGYMCVLKEEAVEKMIHPEALVNQILEKRACFIPHDEWEQLGLPMEDVG